jgi:metal-responsive CopG/Arc/MetJ family transcriptional regulator
MRRLTVSLPDELVVILDAMKQTAEFNNGPYSELLRAMIQRGIEKSKAA